MSFSLTPVYKVKWDRSNGNMLMVAEDDLQAVFRSIIRTSPQSHITIDQVNDMTNQVITEEWELRQVVGLPPLRKEETCGQEQTRP